MPPPPLTSFGSELITQAPYAPRLRETDEVTTGTCWYRVNTHDADRALSAPGLPRMYDSWSLQRALLLCVSRDSEYDHGTDDEITGIGGWSRVRCDFDNAASFKPLAIQGTSYTELSSRTSGVIIMKDVRDAGGSSKSIENGRGTQREIGGTIATVTTFPGPRLDQVLEAAIQLQTLKAVNDSAIPLPTVIGTGLRRVQNERTIRYLDYRTYFKRGMLAVEHQLLVADTPGSWFWWTLGADGSFVDREESWIYDGRTFGNLW